jgi:transcriptional regulator with XRE-family HTH domain
MIGEQIAVLRRARGMTQDQLAEAAGVSVDVIRRLEQGVRHSARLNTLSKIAAGSRCGMKEGRLSRQSGFVPRLFPNVA